MALEDNLDDIARRFNQMADRFSVVAADKWGEVLPELEKNVVEAIKEVTPEVSGHLRDSTTVENERNIGLATEFDVTQPAESAPNMDGSGGGQHYVQWVLPPGRGEITAPSDGPYSTGKRALAGPGFGPVKHVKAYPGSDYPLKADPSIQSATEILRLRWGDEVLSELLGEAW